MTKKYIARCANCGKPVAVSDPDEEDSDNVYCDKCLEEEEDLWEDEEEDYAEGNEFEA